MQELESKIAIAQQEVLGLHNHIHAIEVQIKKTLQGKERELYLDGSYYGETKEGNS